MNLLFYLNEDASKGLHDAWDRFVGDPPNPERFFAGDSLTKERRYRQEVLGHINMLLSYAYPI